MDEITIKEVRYKTKQEIMKNKHIHRTNNRRANRIEMNIFKG